MAIFKKKGAGILDVIRCDEPSYLIWKWRPSGTKSGETTRENAIRLGSHLRVNEGSVAAFFYKSKGDVDYIEGPYDQAIKTSNMPVLSGIIGSFFKGDTPFQAEIYFINIAKEISLKFTVPYFDVYDHRFSDFGVPIAVRGTIHFKIADYKEFVKLHRLTEFSMDNFQNQVRDTVARYVKRLVTNASSGYGIPVLQLERQIDRISELARDEMLQGFRDDFSIDVKRVDISDIDVDKSSEEYEQLRAVTAELDSARAKAQTDVDIKEMYDRQRIESEDYEGRLRIQREEGQYATHKQTQTANLTAYQIEKQAEVGVAGAEALGQMGANNAGGVNLGGSGGGFNPAAMMAGMALGGAVGQNIAGTIGGMMSGVSQPMSPPPIPQIAYHVAVNGQATGPFDINTLTQMVNNNTLTRDTLVWCRGMANWERADNVNELRALFVTVPPVPPTP